MEKYWVNWIRKSWFTSCKIAKAFGMHNGMEENLDLNKCTELEVLPSTKEDLIKNSDFISIHVQGGEI